MSSPAKVTRPRSGAVAAGEDVEAGRLAGAVRAHDSRQPPLVERERDVLQDDLVAEALVQAGRFKEGHAALLAERRDAGASAPAAECRGAARAARARDRAGAQRLPQPAMPSGCHSTMTTNSSPYQSSQVSVAAPSTSRARMKKSAPIAGPQKLTRPPPISTIMTTKPDACRLITFG